MNTPRASQDPNFVQKLDFKSNLDFDVSEYEDRYARVSDAMLRAGLDALLLTTEKNLRYFSGFKSGMWLTGTEWPYVVILTRDALLEPTLIVPEFMEGTAKSTTWFEDIRWPERGPFFGDVMTTIAKTLREKGLDQARIGTELGDKVTMHLSQKRFDYLKDQLPLAQFVDGLETVHEVRKIKSPNEVDALKTAFEITWNAYQKGLSATKPGMTEQELYRLIGSAMCDLGSEPNFFFNITGGASGYCLADGLPSDHPFEKNMLFWLDCGASYKGYMADIARMCCLGQPNQYQEHRIRSIIEANIAAAEEIYAGNEVRETIYAADRILEKNGLAQFRLWDLVGHGLGMSIHEPPYLTEQSYGSTGKDKFEPGMVINIEVSIADVGAWELGRYAVEDTYLVTETGRNWISEAPRDVWIA